jgi:amino acid adenylation domain-containing protein
MGCYLFYGITMASNDELGGGPFEDPGPLSPIQDQMLDRNFLAASPTLRQDGERVVGKDASTNDVPLSFAQERLWFLQQLDPARAAHNIAFRLEIGAALDRAALERAATELVRRHQTFRTVFLNCDGRPMAKIMAPSPVPIVLQDLTQFPEPERERAAVRIADAAARTVFDLTTGPLFRIEALKFAPEHHWLIVTMHHLVGDTSSMTILFRELAMLYNSRSAPLEPPRLQYEDFARWQRVQFERGAMDADLAYWRETLGGKLPVLDLPADRPRSPVQTRNEAAATISFPGDLTRSLQAAAAREGVTLDTLLLVAFKALLHRLSGQEDIIVGRPVPGRMHAELQDLIGFFENTLALRTIVAGEMPFRELLARVGKAVQGACRHRGAPFEKVIDLLQLERDLSRSPVFQVMFSFRDGLVKTLEFGGAPAHAQKVHTGAGQCDLTMSLETTGDRLAGRVHFNSDIFDRATMERFCTHYETLLRGVIADCETTVATLPLLTSAEREQLVVTWNATETPYPRHRCVHELFAEQARRTPNETAAVFEDEKISYRELDRRANAIAAHLRELGAGPEARVGICVHRSIEMLAGLLGILKSGAAYVPLDPAYPKERLTLMVEDAQLHALLTEEALVSGFDSSQTKVVLIESLSSKELDDCPASAATSENLAYVIYTSGSTGRPKGVMIRHRNVVNFFTGMDAVLGPSRGVWLAVTSICFDISVLELLWTVTRGFKVVIQSDEGGLRADAARHRDGRLTGYEIPEQIRRWGVTHLQCTPSLMGMLLQEKGAREAIASVNTLLLGGEALTGSLLDQLQGAPRIINMYGPTETTVWSASDVIEPGAPVTVGRPMANTTIYILDRFQQPVPIGVPGELHIGGDGVVRGYWNRPELTAERFLPNPFAPRERLYRTGDLARYRMDGRIEFLGRLDHQVKLRGFRIELGEIEAALRQIAGVRDAVVVVREVNASDKRLAAYVVGAKPIETAQLRRTLREKLPEYMVPALFTFLPNLPLTPNGKIDRKALPEPEALAAAKGAAFAPPQTGLQQTLARIWRELLGVETIGRNDNFFDLGGHSFLLLQVQARITAALGVEVSVLQLFQNPTVTALARLLGDAPNESPPVNKFKARAHLQRQTLARRARAEVNA